MVWLHGKASRTSGNPSLLLVLLATLLGLAVSTGAAAESAGRFLFAKGQVELLRDSESPHQVRRGDSVEVGDRVRTGGKSSAQLRLSDGAMIALRAHSLFRVERQDYREQAPGEGSQATELLRGGMRAITGAIGSERPSAVQYKTPVGTIGIRGTVIDVIYVPPEGLPGISGIKPGLYVRVLKGAVEISNPGGELSLGRGEIAFVADKSSAPELRPDLAEVFDRYDAITAEQVLDDNTESESGNRLAVASDRELAKIDNILTETAKPEGTVTPGPLAYVVSTDGFSTTWHGEFLSSNVTLSAAEELVAAYNGTGDIASFEAQTTPATSDSATVGDSTINWGVYDYLSYSALDSSGKISPANNYTAYYIAADQVLLTIFDLPTTGSYTYYYVGGAGSMQLDNTSYIDVDFGTGSMYVSLDAEGDNWSSSNSGSVTDFYGSGIILTNDIYGNGSISGRFVGSNAEGAMTWYELPGVDGTLNTGTAAFAR